MLLSEQLLALINERLSGDIVSAVIDRNDVFVETSSDKISALLKKLKEETAFSFDLLVDITAIDWMDKRPVRFEVVYHLLSIKNLYRVRIKVPVSELACEIASAVPLWAGANFLEREVWDMYGIKFTGHPDLRRILLYEEFVGYPLRKDYPVQGKQPRIKLRAPEVHNTARNMNRPTLVSIRKKQRVENRNNKHVEGSLSLSNERS